MGSSHSNLNSEEQRVLEGILFDIPTIDSNQRDLIRSTVAYCLDLLTYELQIEYTTCIFREASQLLNSSYVGVYREGWLFKRGKLVKSWRNRWFILNQWTLTYSKLKGNVSIKGEINLRDYYIRKFTLSEEKEHGFYGLVIICATRNPSNRREWYLLAKSLEDQLSWLQVINYACHTSKKHWENEDQITKKSFLCSLKDVRGISEPWFSYGNVSKDMEYWIYEVLEKLNIDIMNNKKLGDYVETSCQYQQIRWKESATLQHISIQKKAKNFNTKYHQTIKLLFKEILEILSTYQIEEMIFKIIKRHEEKYKDQVIPSVLNGTHECLKLLYSNDNIDDTDVIVMASSLCSSYFPSLLDSWIQKEIFYCFYRFLTEQKEDSRISEDICKKEMIYKKAKSYCLECMKRIFMFTLMPCVDHEIPQEIGKKLNVDSRFLQLHSLISEQLQHFIDIKRVLNDVLKEETIRVLTEFLSITIEKHINTI